MLILTRRRGEEVYVAVPPKTSQSDIRIVVLEVFSNGVVKIGVDASRDIQVTRDNAIVRTANKPREATVLPEYNPTHGDGNGNEEKSDDDIHG